MSAHNPTCTFRNSALSALLDDAILPTMGVLSPDADDAEAFALRVGYARDRVVGYQRVKAAALQARSVSCAGKNASATFRGRVDDVVLGSALSSRQGEQSSNRWSPTRAGRVRVLWRVTSFWAALPGGLIAQTASRTGQTKSGRIFRLTYKPSVLENSLAFRTFWC